MSDYIPYIVNFNNIENVQNWAQHLANGVDLEVLGYEGEREQQQLGLLLHNAHEATSATVKNYVDIHINAATTHMNTSFNNIYNAYRNDHGVLLDMADTIESLQKEVESLKQLTTLQGNLLATYKAQLDKFPADAGAGPSSKSLKVPEPSTFSGSDSKSKLDDWINQIALFNSATGVVTDHQKIVTAMLRLRSPATTYMKKYYDKVGHGEDLGSWESFLQELKNIYGKRDDKEGAKLELTQLWLNKALANKDFIKYSEQYRTLARITEYEDSVLIDKLKEVIPQELKNALVIQEMNGTLPKAWQEYLDLLLKAYKALHPEKAKSVIFGNGNKGNGNTSDSDAMEIDSAKKSKGKSKEANSQEVKKKKHCNICAAKGLKNKASSHNTNDCWDKPGNESKKPAPKSSSSTSSSSVQNNKVGQGAPGAKKSFKARLLEFMKEMDDDDDGTAPPAATVNINSARIVEIPDSQSAIKGTTVQVDEVQSGPSRSTGQKLKVNRRSNVDFPDAL
ncbi:hypothetical protein E1B28_008366 [Marasmius oreades]|uniref:Ty3 transposon capsid-like protein domain-containing protein n=1 Tax=Marasmius oreades TaxID=181124 RepID=A0A9P7RZU2_9AGAR|nr:uncharacterized protein E1B28_008366 [Marasmius oreades]KAG7091978.1 hypothetical protein E1B28_008366 [Marasmius oreades]